MCATGSGFLITHLVESNTFYFLSSGLSFLALKTNGSVEGIGPKKTMRKIQVSPSKFLFDIFSSPPSLPCLDVSLVVPSSSGSFPSFLSKFPFHLSGNYSKQKRMQHGSGPLHSPDN